MEPVISEVTFKRKNGLNFVSVDFQNGDIKEEFFDSLACKLYPDGDKSGKLVDVKVPDGHTYTNTTMYDKPKNVFIGIRKKDSNKIKLLEIDSALLIHSLYLEKNENRTENQIQNVKELNATLNRTFGSKKAMRNLEKINMTLDSSQVESQMKDVLEDTGALNISVQAEDEEKTLSKLIPFCNRDAKHLDDVYKIEDLMTQEELDSLEDDVYDIMQSRDEVNEINIDSEYFKSFIKIVFEATDEEILKCRISCLLYADALIRYLKAKANTLAKMSSTFCPQSQLICSKIIREFCVKTGSSLNRPLSMKDKAVCYIIILTLRACGYKINLDTLSTLCGYAGLNKWKQLARIVGIMPESKNSKMYALTLPVPKPPKMVKTMKKGR